MMDILENIISEVGIIKIIIFYKNQFERADILLKYELRYIERMIENKNDSKKDHESDEETDKEVMTSLFPSDRKKDLEKLKFVANFHKWSLTQTNQFTITPPPLRRPNSPGEVRRQQVIRAFNFSTFDDKRIAVFSTPNKEFIEKEINIYNSNIPDTKPILDAYNPIILEMVSIWKDILGTKDKIPGHFFIEYQNYLNSFSRTWWHSVFLNNKIKDDDFINYFKDKFSWEHISLNMHKFEIAEELLLKFSDLIIWPIMYQEYQPSLEFIRKNPDKVDWDCISQHKQPLDVLREFKDRLNWSLISQAQTLSEKFIIEFQDKVDWRWISKDQKLSEDFIREFRDRVDWKKISEYQQLSEDFIREFKDKVEWNIISYSQKLSEDFIEEFENKVNWILINKTQKLNEMFRQRHFKKLGGECSKYLIDESTTTPGF